MAILQVPVVKGKATIEVDTDSLPEDVYREVIMQGLKVMVNRMSKVTKETYPQEEALKAAAMAKAEENLQAMKEGKVRLSKGGKTKGVSGAAMTEARRIARQIIKDACKRKGIRISTVPAKDITAAANQYLESHPEIIEKAKEAIAAREAEASMELEGIALPQEDSKLVAKVEAEKAKAKKTTEDRKAAKQVAHRAKPKAEASHATH